MRVRVTLENCGHTMSKVVDVAESPAVGSVVQADVYLLEDVDDQQDAAPARGAPGRRATIAAPPSIELYTCCRLDGTADGRER